MQPVLGQALFLEYEEVLGPEAFFRKYPLSAAERRELFESFLSVLRMGTHLFTTCGGRIRAMRVITHIIEFAVAVAPRRL